MVEIQDVRLSAHKGAHLSDSDAYTDIGLSSEEEAEDLDPAPQFRRKFDRPTPPQPDPTPPVPPQPQQPQPSTSADQATVTVPKEALQQVHALLGQILQGQVPTGLGGVGGAAGEDSSQMPPGSNQFNVRRAKEGEKVCQVCQRKFWNTDTLRRHQKTHTGAQRYTCINPTVDCGRKLASKRSFDVHRLVCGVEKTKFCLKQGCKKIFATADGLKAHLSTHKKLSKKNSCPHCIKSGFTREKSLKDHIRFVLPTPTRLAHFPAQ